MRHVAVASLLLGCGGGSGKIDPSGDTASPTGGGTTTTPVPCELEVAVPGAASLDAGVFLEADPHDGPFSELRLRARAVTISSSEGATLTLSGEGLTLWATDGTPLSSPHGVEAPSSTVLVHGATRGSGGVEVTPSCDAEPVAFDLHVDTPRGLAGRSLVQYPHFEVVDAFNADDAVQTALDPTRYRDRAGAAADVYIVEHRSRDEWAADPSLTDVADGPVPVTVGATLADSIADVWLSDLTAGPDLTTPFDVVYDFGRDGTLDPGDLVDGLDGAGFEAVIPLAAAGPYTPEATEHSASFWNTHRVYFPTEIESLGALPLVVISHGNGHDYTWYDYLGEHLASWGYVVISHRNDTEPGPVRASATTRTNTATFLADLPSIAGGRLVGHVDDGTIVWIGHSRGGEGVVLAYDDLVEGDEAHDEFGWEDVRIVSSIAPTLFQTPFNADPHGVTYHLLAGSSDGDVTGGPDFGLTQYFRIFQNGTGDALVTYVQGASHNDFNCCGFDDGSWTTGPGRQISRPDAQQAAKSYYLALLEYELRGRTVLGEYLWRMPAQFRPMMVDLFLSNQWTPGADAAKVVIDDFQSEPDPTVSSSGGAVRAGVGDLVEGVLDDPDNQLAWNGAPMNGMTWAHDDDPLRAERGVVFEWADGDSGSLEFELPGGARDLSAGGHVAFRVCQGTRHPYTVGLDDLLSFSVVLVDGAGTESAIDFGTYGRIPEPFGRNGLGGGTGWSNEFTTVRVPVLAFTTDRPELDLSDLTTLRFDVGAAHGSPTGRVGLDDVEILLP